MQNHLKSLSNIKQLSGKQLQFILGGINGKGNGGEKAPPPTAADI